jgi:hypothetical protein
MHTCNTTPTLYEISLYTHKEDSLNAISQDKPDTPTVSPSASQAAKADKHFSQQTDTPQT